MVQAQNTLDINLTCSTQVGCPNRCTTWYSYQGILRRPSVQQPHPISRSKIYKYGLRNKLMKVIDKRREIFSFLQFFAKRQNNWQDFYTWPVQDIFFLYQVKIFSFILNKNLTQISWSDRVPTFGNSSWTKTVKLPSLTVSMFPGL